MSGFSSCKESEMHGGRVGPLGSRMFEHVLDLQKFIQEKTGHIPDVFASCFDADRNLFTSASTSNWDLENPSDEEYIAKVQERMPEFSEVYVVGHSYGGWLSMKLIESWQGSPTLIKSLNTIDPISKKLCFFDTPADCLSAPKDISGPARQHIQDHTGLWVNSWQQKTIFLHSSSIRQADENPMFDVSHWEIDNHLAIWDSLKSRLSL
jgi:pimeloyl-ACP methyl ester carboxylesterase